MSYFEGVRLYLKRIFSKHPNPCKEGHKVKGRPDLGRDEKGRDRHIECVNCHQIFTPTYYVPKRLNLGDD